MSITEPLGILLIAHGSRRAEANEDLVVLRQMVQSAYPDAIVRHAYLELTHPTIPKGAHECVAQGVKRVVLLPYFLSLGTHVVDDLQQYCREFSAQFPDVQFDVAAPLGLHPLMLQIVTSRLNDTLLDNATPGT
jgi:sirohydrochlorin ferrochelatase